MAKQNSALARWLGAQPRGAMRRLMLRSGLSHGTIDRAKRGLTVQRETAELISACTNGGVPVDHIPHVRRGEAARAEASAKPAESDSEPPRSAA